MAAMRVSVVIVNYRTPTLTERAVHSALGGGAGDVVVVDNASADGSAAMLSAIRDVRVRVVENDRNAGFGAAADLGAQQASGDVLLFLNSDARLRSDAVSILAAEVERAAGRAIVGPRLVGEDGDIQRSAGLVPKPDDLLVRGLGIHHLGRALGRLPLVGRLLSGNRIAMEYDQAITATGPIGVSMVSGACMAIGREAFEELGGFDQRYFMYFEDADLCRRATRAGWPVRYVPNAIVDHVGGASSAGDYRFGPMHAASMVRYLRDWHGRSGLVTGLAILLLRAMGHALTLRPSTRVTFHALRAGLAVAAREG